MDPRTGKNIFARTEREVKLTATPPTKHVPPLTVAAAGASVSTRMTAAVNVGMHTARSSMKSSRTYQSTARGFKKAQRTALMTLKVGELIVTKEVVAPIVRLGAREWRKFNAYRGRQRSCRRSKTLDWFEDRARTMQETEEM